MSEWLRRPALIDPDEARARIRALLELDFPTVHREGACGGQCNLCSKNAA